MTFGDEQGGQITLHFPPCAMHNFIVFHFSMQLMWVNGSSTKCELKTLLKKKSVNIEILWMNDFVFTSLKGSTFKTMCDGKKHSKIYHF